MSKEKQGGVENEIDALKAELQQSQEALVQAQEKAAAAAESQAEVELERDALKDVIEGLEAQIEALTKKNAEPVAEVKSAPVKLPTDTFEVDGVKKKFRFPVFNYKGHKVTAAEALQSQSLLAELVEAGSAVIVDA